MLAANPPKGYLNIESGGIDFSGPLKWIVIAAVFGGLLHLSYWWLTKLRKERELLRERSGNKESRAQEFLGRAQHLGFRQGEARTVERIARRLAPKSPLNLLNSGQGREFLIGDLEKRISRRGREIKVLDRIKERLEALRSSDVHERESVRVDANISVWVSKKGLTPEVAALVEDEDDAEGEGLFANLDSVSGKLVDISEGGAAIEVDLDAARGDQILFWSGDPHILLGETRSGVISTEQTDTARILHVHFIDPDLHNLRATILQLRGEEE